MTDRSYTVAKVLLLAIVVLVGHAVWQERRMSRLEADTAYQQRHFDEQAGALAVEKLHGRRADIVQAIQWLHEYYQSEEGLQRPSGLWREADRRLDAEAIGAWVFDVYLNARVSGKTTAEAQEMVKSAIRSSEEWRVRHVPR